MKKWISYSLCLVFSSTIYSQQINNEIDNVTLKAMELFDVPGIAVAVIKDGKVIHSKGYGVRSINHPEKVDIHTNFGIASNSKAFTSAALAILIDRNKLHWDDRVIQYIPEFKMYNEYVTHEFTIRDLLTHKSGLGLGAGDLMVWPDGHNFTSKDVIQNIQFLKAVSSFRTRYDYDNLLYIIAGVVIERVSGMSWAEFVEKEIMNPLEMKKSAGNWNRLADKSNVIDPHVPIDGELQVIDRYTNTIFDAAAGIYSNVDDLSKWVLMQLNEGKTEEKTIFSKERHVEMWTPQTLMSNQTVEPYFSLFRAYGLGWQLTDVSGKLQVSHTGGLEGIVTQITLLPQEKLGIIVLTNQQSGYAFSAITNTIKNHYLGLPYIDFNQDYFEKSQHSAKNADNITEAVWLKATNNSKEAIENLNSLIGEYKDNWFGEVSIFKDQNQYVFKSKRSPQLTGEILFYDNNTFIVKWFNRYFHADAFIHLEEPLKTKHFRMSAISPLTDFSYDFHDLNFKPISEIN